MAWMMDAYGQLHGHSPAIVTGKPLELGGSLGREAATGRGVAYILQEAAKDLELDPKGARIVVQGFGNVGSWAARLMYEDGCRVIAVSGSRGGVYNPTGLDIPRLLQYNGEHRTVVGFPGGDSISNEELLELECDVLVPAALDRVITARNAPEVKTKLVLEGANHPLTPEADDIFKDRGIVVLPDILVNAGGVIASYFEWTQNLQQLRWEEERVNQELHKILVRAYQEVRERVAAQGITYREAALDIGVERVARAVELRGFV